MLYISALSVLINFIKLLVSELIISYLGFIIILLYLREIYRMCKGKSTSATKIQNAAEFLFSKSKYLYGTFDMIRSNRFAIILNGNKLQVYKKKIIHVYLSNLKTEHYNIGTTL